MPAKNRRNQDIRLINPMFNIPEGVLNYEYEELYSFDDDGAELLDAESDEPQPLIDEWDAEDTAEEELEVPTEFYVVDEIIRTMADGSQQVDLVIEVINEEENVEYGVHYVEA